MLQNPSLIDKSFVVKSIIRIKFVELEISIQSLKLLTFQNFLTKRTQICCQIQSVSMQSNFNVYPCILQYLCVNIHFFGQ